MDDASTARHIIRLGDLDDALLTEVLDLSARMREDRGLRDLDARTVGMLFFRGSLRTRVSLETAVYQLGGHVLDMTALSDFWELEEHEGVVMDGRAPEHVRDAAQVLSRYVDALAIRPALDGRSWEIDRKDERIRTWARHCSVPVINMESALWHPLQALADLLTLRDTLGDPKGGRLAIVWVHSPEPASASVVHSLLQGALRLGIDVRVAHPPGFELDAGVLDEARALAGATGAALEDGLTLEDAVEGAQVVYARAWASNETYGNATLAASHRSRLKSWMVDEKLLTLGEDAKLMHAMPVRRNVEVTDEVLDGPRSLVYEQAGNRLHSQKALLARLLGR